ncbi:putative ATP-dependent DNA helicase YoaA [Paraburkholderia domus]|uniref:ATP-dependent DNA helicase YoaA n=1 Tax=Paraburkholderia domus TaxID=2793075 RepID=A0A9N8MSY9_9BURK|nr:ATP-dependent DNA helicase [Paraburkholderia domus]MBK5048657.1 ATP-dependent DNA helicase [Burkholderia sp. R-70006]MBK5060754.1 ATP-dependent DNA helicase [Burkholderia sp. R-70199]MBK5085767.1 ATP-dependent DNA helicase [Burkholderia sp. R-69927]MBK5120650.1 ATP-dependent DNA helicase [Burkholderia sp. R-69980]MBK5165953.1 ATP-dependent DNA helicase [Burkholderia sp. R-70211]MBK5180510.1 ATP-dependent DNA helicase [Burkholderia sp. R-69749]MCI0146117.1 ATP-dependent DNA helicase [Parab
MNSPLETSPRATASDDAAAAGSPVAGAPASRPPTSALSASLNPRRVAELDDIFADNGLLARQIDGYRSRASQIEMSRAVAAAMEASGRAMPEPAMFEAQKRPARRLQSPGANAAPDVPENDESNGLDGSENTLIVEAGTGTGKTYAYLVPAMLWGGKVIVSTGTKHLQDQLFQRDIPTVRDALAVPVSVAMLKGRANYLCHYYLQRTADNGRLPSRQETSYLQDIIRFAKITRTGDKAELASVPETAAVWSMVTSTRENCLGQECPHYKECFVMQARREAQQADIVVVNHHLFFADIMLRDTGMAELLPTANTVIFDEAHQLPETATLFFGETLSTTQFLELARDSVAEGLGHARETVDWVTLGSTLERAARDVRLAFKEDSVRLSIGQLPDDHPLFPALETLETELDALASALAGQAERAESIGACLRRARELQGVLAGWTTPPTETERAAAEQAPADAKAERADPNEKVRWIEVFAHTVQLHETPLSVAPIFAKQRAGVPRAWIFTSATLSVRGDFTHYAAQMGLNAKRSMTLPSPFDYPTQGLLYVPRNLPQPSSPMFTDAVFDAALPAIEASGGGVFMLCTTLRAVDRISAKLRDTIEARGWGYPLLVQGDASRTELLDRFRAYGNAILVGSQSFWEGVDVRGDALSLVVIDKLPFAPPDDPVLSARLDALTKKGLSPFAVHQLPQAVITLKQGAGRLIRAETDRGVLMICDTRLVDKPYGRRIWQSLPPFKRTREIEVVREFFEENATPAQ